MSKIKVTIETEDGSFTAVSKDVQTETACRVLGVFAAAMDGMTFSENYDYFFEYGDYGEVVRVEADESCISKKTKKKIRKANKDWA